MKIILTGGHITPALALLSKLAGKHSVFFVGRKYGFEGDKTTSFEYKTITEMGIPFNAIIASRLQRYFSLHTVFSLLKFPIGFFQSLFFLLKVRPHIILSFGGYVGLPVCLAGFLLGIPIVIHEQTVSNAGLANRISAFFARKICISFESSRKYFPSAKTVFTGNPIRKELLDLPAQTIFPELKRKLAKPLIYVTGGSGGSHSINMLIHGALKDLLLHYTLIHQTGDSSQYKDFDMLSKKAAELSPILARDYIVKKHITAQELSWIYRNASLLIGRSGANTVYEVLTFGLPSLFIPLPWAGFSEQLANAQLVKRVGLGRLLEQNELTSETFLRLVSEMTANTSEYKKHAVDAQKYIVSNAHEKIIAVLEASA